MVSRFAPNNCAVFDMDGTLADVSSIRHHLDKPKGKKDFDSFHEESINVPANHSVWMSAKILESLGFPIIIVTARQEKWLWHTLLWLADQQISHTEIFMRENGDFRPDYEIKADILAKMRKRGWNPAFAFDDNPAIIQMWKDHGIPCIEVPGWDKALTVTEG